MGERSPGMPRGKLDTGFGFANGLLDKAHRSFTVPTLVWRRQLKLVVRVPEFGKGRLHVALGRRGHTAGDEGGKEDTEECG